MLNSVTLQRLSSDWQSCSRQYRPGAFWFWNAEMTPEQIDDMLFQIQENDIREVVLHPIHGMEIEYLSDIYFERYRYALKTAKKHGLKVWVYDDYGWPSGNAGGKLLEKHPEYKAWFLSYNKDQDGKVSVQPKLSDRVLDNVVGANWSNNEKGMLNSLSREAVGCFIEMTHQRYYDECKEYFGDVIQGFFTDEPVCMIGQADSQTEIWNTVGLPWSPEVPSLFKEKYGYDIREHYLDLIYSEDRKYRDDYNTLISELYLNAYHAQISCWCKEHGVSHIGHIGEDAPLMQVRFSRNSYKALSMMDIPGVDLLSGQVCPEYRFFASVFVASVARRCNRKRVYCEAFGASTHDIRLGQMFRVTQMLGIFGVNDINIMGFHQSLDGVRKRMYWPALFNTAPWWEFYGIYLDASARSLALTSLGRPKFKYAILFPQYHLEHNDIFMNVWDTEELVIKSIETLGNAIYESGEAFEFIFEENLTDAQLSGGKIVIGDSEYSQILIPSHFMQSDQTMLQIKRLSQNIMPIEDIVCNIRQAQPVWGNLFSIQGCEQKQYRIYEFDYPDGQLFVVRNISHEAIEIDVTAKSPEMKLSQWDPALGNCFHRDFSIDFKILPNSTAYFSLSKSKIGEVYKPYKGIMLIEGARWYVEAEKDNLSRFENPKFYHDELGWLPSEKLQPQTKEPLVAMYIPHQLKGRTVIKMSGGFCCSSIPERLGIAYEKGHIEDLLVNGEPIDLTIAQPSVLWDGSCMFADISKVVHTGINNVEATLKFQKSETSLYSDGFFRGRPVMPSCDVCLAGGFKLIGNKICSDDKGSFTLPLKMDEAGWGQYLGVIRASTDVFISQEIAEKISGLDLTMVAEDSVEVLIDGQSIGRRIVYPYCFPLKLNAGRHRIELRISSTSGNIIDTPNSFGVLSAGWLY